MKPFRTKILMLGVLTAMTACGGNSKTTAVPAGVTTAAPVSCPSGTVYNTQTSTCNPTIQTQPVVAPVNPVCSTSQVYNVQYGCIPQGNCKMGFGQFVNSPPPVGHVQNADPKTIDQRNMDQSGYEYGSSSDHYEYSYSYQYSYQYYSYQSQGSTIQCAEASPGGTCAAGNVYSQIYGCVAQGSCLAGCGMISKNSGCVHIAQATTPTTATPPIVSGGNSCCAQGSFNTQYGCLAQENCSPNQVKYNNACYNLYSQGDSQWQGGLGAGIGFQIHLGFGF